MEVKIGIHNVSREVTLEVDLGIDKLLDNYRQALATADLLSLTDVSGRLTVIPATSIAYLEFGQEHARHVGFATRS